VGIAAGETIDVMASCAEGDVAVGGGFVFDGTNGNLLGSYRVDEGS
jgi:hypothetical protein